MFQFKLFNSDDYGDNLTVMQHKINDWFNSHHPDIRFMSQSSLSTHLLISFVFTESYRLEAGLTQTVTAVPDVYQHMTNDLTLDPDKNES